MSAIRWVTSLALLSAAGSAGAATPHTVNAAEIGTGVPRGINWSQEAVESPMWCGGACSYMQVSTAKIAPDSLLKYGPTAWPGNYVTTMPNVAAVERETLTPAGTTDSSGREIVHDSPHYERGAVDVNRAGEFLNTRVYQSGNQSSGGTGFGAAAAAYHVKVTNQSSGNRDYFVQFVAPSRTGGVSVPYYQGGPSGNQYFNVSQNKYAKSRSAVDVLVNGLPVWSTSRSYIIPEETGQTTLYTGHPLDFGSASADDAYTIFVGRFAGGVSFELDFIVRAEAHSRASECGKINESSQYPNPRSFIHCLYVNEGRELYQANGPGHFSIYSKVISTPIYELPGGGVIGPASSTVLNASQDE